jgi:Undecaprenyl-phosphate glucose phosphotransferase
MSDLALEAAPVTMHEIREDGPPLLQRIEHDPVAVSAKALQAGLASLDMAVLTSAGIVAACVDQHFPAALLPTLTASAAGATWLFWTDSYRIRQLRVPGGQIWITGGACLIWLLAMIVSSTTLSTPDRLPWPDLGVAAVVAWAVLGTSRIFTALLLRAWTRSGRLDRKMAVVGLNDLSHSFIQRLRADPRTDVRIVSAYRTPLDRGSVTHAGVLVRGDIADLVLHSRAGMFDLVVIALPPEQAAITQGILQSLASCLCDVSVVSDVQPFRLPGTRLEDVGGGFNLAVRPRPVSGRYAVQKTVFDWVVALLLLVMTLPAFAVIAAAIRIESRGPVFFRQIRCGRNGQQFNILKFRTMYSEFEDPRADRQATRDDRRVTRVGRWLRRTSLDELPQLINVLEGDMSLVGPRPHALGTRAGQRSLEAIADGYGMRHRVKPGMTGLAQINGCRGALRSEEQVIQRVAYDVQYIDQWSLWLDLKILCLTVVTCLDGKNAY